MFEPHEAKLLRDIVQEETTMRKTALTILGALLIAGSAVQMATASEHHVRKAYRAPMAATQQFRNANNSIEGRANSFRNYNLDFDRRNTFN
jgi:hypothetical protein